MPGRRLVPGDRQVSYVGGWTLPRPREQPVLLESCAAGCPYISPAHVEKLRVVGLVGRGRGRWGQERVLPGSGFGITLLLTCCLHLSPSFRAALLSISFQHMHAHRKAALASTSPFPTCLQERRLQTHLPYHQTRTRTPSTHPMRKQPARLPECELREL